jgi:hypothetical protein
MCLRSKTNIPEIAKEDIVCYKIIERVSSNKYKSPYQGDEIIFNKTIIASKPTKKFNMMPTVDVDLKTIIGYYIGEGFIHAFIIKENAKCSVLNHYYFLNFEGTTIVKCIIPKGSRYFISIDNVEICSDRMMITDEIIYSY